MKNLLRVNCHENISAMFKLFNSQRYDLRNNNNKLMLSKPETNSMKRTFGYAAAKVWNERNKTLNSIALSYLDGLNDNLILEGGVSENFLYTVCDHTT